MISGPLLNVHVKATPFRPLRIRMASGDSLVIKHPEMVRVGRSTATIHYALSDDPRDAALGVREVSLLLMESVEPIDAPLTQDVQ